MSFFRFKLGNPDGTRSRFSKASTTKYEQVKLTMFTIFFQSYLKIFFILTPFFAISAFLSLTQEMSPAERRVTAIKVTLAVIIISVILYLYGRYIFELFGITLDAFRIGAGAVLFISALNMVNGGSKKFEAGERRTT